ncbi:uncharacterized protein ARMOST_22107 [Armillaria ostoyae]|uniref:DUF6533 domain-containing protein n=1 Tax=Armillaria ostoyae TaxID=47428 RepID=A0A284SBY6_ARMOS|nr:uncharacterized protein ARMOST_22107 [Armillaria ostoyae]
MSTTLSVGEILFARYTPRMLTRFAIVHASGPDDKIAAGIALLLWDHFLTFDEEVTVMWASFKGPILPKAIYVMNRYFTEAVLLYTVYVFTGLRRPTANEIVDAFTTVELPSTVIVCAVLEVPKTTPFLLGILLLFNLFVISVSFYNALEEPRQRESEVFNSLRHDGAKIYFIVSLSWVLLLITSVFAEMVVYFPILILAWSVAANLTSRMHLRIESLRLSNIVHLP